jgi:hypothetical protein
VPHEVNKSIQRSIKRAVSKSKSAKGPTNESITNGSQEKSTPEAI